MVLFAISRLKDLSTAGSCVNLDLEHGLQFLPFPCKEVSTAGPCANLRLRKKEKETWLILPVVICLSQRLSGFEANELPGTNGKLASFCSRPASMAILLMLASISRQCTGGRGLVRHRV